MEILQKIKNYYSNFYEESDLILHKNSLTIPLLSENLIIEYCNDVNNIFYNKLILKLKHKKSEYIIKYMDINTDIENILTEISDYNLRYHIGVESDIKTIYHLLSDINKRIKLLENKDNKPKTFNTEDDFYLYN